MGFDYASPDLAEIVYHVKQFSNGKTPYLHDFSHHFFGFLIPLVVVEQFIEIKPELLKVLTVIYQFISMLFCVLCAKELFGRRAGLGAFFLFAALGWVPGLQGFAFNVQSQILPFLSAYLYLLCRSIKGEKAFFYVAAAALAGLLLSFDQRLVLFPLLLMLPLYFQTAHRKKSVFFAAIIGFAVFPMIFLLILFVKGALPDFFFQTFLFPLFARNQSVSTGFFLTSISLLCKALTNAPVLFVYAGFGLFCMLPLKEAKWKFAFLVSIFVCSITYALIGGRIFVNYLILLVPPAILSASFGLSLILKKIEKSRRFLPVGYSLVPLLVWIVPFIYNITNGKLFSVYQDSIYEEAGDYIANKTKAADNILVWGYAPSIYLQSGRTSVLRDISLLSLLPAETSSKDLNSYLEDLYEDYLSQLQSPNLSAIALYSVTNKQLASILSQDRLYDQNERPFRDLEKHLNEDFIEAKVFHGNGVTVRIFLRRSSVHKTPGGRGF